MISSARPRSTGDPELASAGPVRECRRNERSSRFRKERAKRYRWVLMLLTSGNCRNDREDQVAILESVVTADPFTSLEANGVPENRSIIHAGMELTPFATGVH